MTGIKMKTQPQTQEQIQAEIDKLKAKMKLEYQSKIVNVKSINSLAKRIKELQAVLNKLNK